MTVTLEPELERELSHKADDQGQGAEVYLSQLIKEALRQPMPAIVRSKLTTEVFIESWLEGAERAKARNPPPSTSDFRREGIYDDEW